MKKKYLELVLTVLNQTELKLADARIRDAFLKELASHLESYSADRLKILKEYCDKDEQGEPIINKEQYSFKPEVVQDLSKELETFLNEEINITISEDIKRFISESNYKPKVGEAEMIDQLIS